MTFDEPDEDSVNAHQKNDRVINEASVGEPEPEEDHMMMEYDKRRMSLKTGGPEVRMDSVESTEVRIHIKES